MGGVDPFPSLLGALRSGRAGAHGNAVQSSEKSQLFLEVAAPCSIPPGVCEGPRVPTALCDCPSFLLHLPTAATCCLILVLICTSLARPWRLRTLSVVYALVGCLQVL